MLTPDLITSRASKADIKDYVGDSSTERFLNIHWVCFYLIKKKETNANTK